ncbi:F-box protein [Tripterygium wilfordii]|uniref:F-box protein n=1 Tax=Tripterygium wilfordii TaxID=458696 RepID=A0A7J7C3B3_TRIWF|nr:F-box protein SKIP27-like [Tripterygium wilfordii]KAF5728640.1 F-box protein [Tripterygium wilfordii]
MALGKRSRALKSKRGTVSAADEVLGYGFVKYTRGFGRKRVVISNDFEAQFLHSSPRTSSKRQCSQRMSLHFEKSALETLPQDILIRVLCGLEHGDLKQLFHVSKAIREATLIARQLHFEYSTPRKIRAFRNSIDLEEEEKVSELEDLEAPNAPNQSRRCRSQISDKSLADISVALFASPRMELFM